MAAGSSYSRVANNSSTMANTLESTQSRRRHDFCCGIHGAARERKGIKRGTSAARRRHDKEVIREELEQV